MKHHPNVSLKIVMVFFALVDYWLVLDITMASKKPISFSGFSFLYYAILFFRVLLAFFDVR